MGYKKLSELSLPSFVCYRGRPAWAKQELSESDLWGVTRNNGNKHRVLNITRILMTHLAS